MHTNFNVTDRLIPNELQLGQKFLERFGVSGPLVQKPKYLGYPYDGIPQRNRLFLSIVPGNVESVQIYYRGIDSLDNDFILSSLLNDIYAKYKCIKEGTIKDILIRKSPNESSQGRDFVHAMQLVFNEYASFKKHIALSKAKFDRIKDNSYELYNEDAVSKEGIPLEKGRTSFLKDVHDFIDNEGRYSQNEKDIGIRHKYAKYFIMLLADQVKADLLGEEFPREACIPTVTTEVAVPIRNIFDMLIDKSNEFYNQFSLGQFYKLIGFMGLFLYYHIKLGQTFQNDMIRIYDPNEAQGDPADKQKRTRKEKRAPRQKLSVELFQIGYFGNSPKEQSKLLIGAMQVENYLLHYFHIKEQFVPNDQFDSINRRLLTAVPFFC